MDETDDRSSIGTTKNCGECGSRAMLLSRDALKEILSTLSLLGDARLSDQYGPAWICSRCGSYEPAESSAHRQTASSAATKSTPPR